MAGKHSEELRRIWVTAKGVRGFTQGNTYLPTASQPPCPAPPFPVHLFPCPPITPEEGLPSQGIGSCSRMGEGSWQGRCYLQGRRGWVSRWSRLCVPTSMRNRGPHGGHLGDKSRWTGIFSHKGQSCLPPGVSGLIQVYDSWR